jgi:hypothetical protein
VPGQIVDLTTAGYAYLSIRQFSRSIMVWAAIVVRGKVPRLPTICRLIFANRRHASFCRTQSLSKTLKSVAGSNGSPELPGTPRNQDGLNRTAHYSG